MKVYFCDISVANNFVSVEGKARSLPHAVNTPLFSLLIDWWLLLAFCLGVNDFFCVGRNTCFNSHQWIRSNRRGQLLNFYRDAFSACKDLYSCQSSFNSIHELRLLNW